MAEIQRVEVGRGDETEGNNLVAIDALSLGMIIDVTHMLHPLTTLGKNGCIDDKTILVSCLGPGEFAAKVPDEAPVEGTPAPLPILESIEGVFAGLIEGAQPLLHQLMDARDFQEGQAHQDKQQMDWGISIPFTDAGRGQMALHAQQREQLLDPEIQVGEGHPQYRFDLSLKRRPFCRIHREAPCCGFF
jgi:hypothetical protein